MDTSASPSVQTLIEEAKKDLERDMQQLNRVKSQDGTSKDPAQEGSKDSKAEDEEPESESDESEERGGWISETFFLYLSK